jgi:signal-transduction protein with cAMP-binding, CBS, and nucleotidyltransferase domain
MAIVKTLDKYKVKMNKNNSIKVVITSSITYHLENDKVNEMQKEKERRGHYFTTNYKNRKHTLYQYCTISRGKIYLSLSG